MNINFQFGPNNPFNDARSSKMIELQQTGFDRFTVVYGLQVKRNLSYAQAAAELGACIMHYQCCEGHLDGRTAKEAREDSETKPYFVSL